MPGNDYHFITRWQVQGTIDEVTKIMEDADTSANQAIIAAPPPATAIPAAPLAVRAIVLASVAGAVWLLLRAGRRKA